MLVNYPTVHRQLIFVSAITSIPWLGEYIHNLVELPQLSVISPENSLPALVSLMLLLVWRLTPFKRTAALLLLLLGVLHLIGGVISVIPFGFLPFYPEQTLKHFAAHVGYGLAQLPLIVLMTRQLGAD